MDKKNLCQAEQTLMPSSNGYREQPEEAATAINMLEDDDFFKKLNKIKLSAQYEIKEVQGSSEFY